MAADDICDLCGSTNSVVAMINVDVNGNSTPIYLCMTHRMEADVGLLPTVVPQSRWYV